MGIDITLGNEIELNEERLPSIPFHKRDFDWCQELKCDPEEMIHEGLDPIWFRTLCKGLKEVPGNTIQHYFGVHYTWDFQIPEGFEMTREEISRFKYIQVS